MSPTAALQSRGLILKDGVRGIENAIEFQSQRNADAKELGGQVRELQTQQTAHEVSSFLFVQL